MPWYSTPIFRLLLTGCLVAGFIRGQEPAPAMLRGGATLVLIPVTVRDKLNRFVVGLDKENFRLLEDEHEQKITHFSGEDAPLSIGLLLDTSGSMDLKLQRSREAAREFLKTMNEQDEAFLVEFNDTAEMLRPFTNNFQDIENGLNALHPKGMTALFDALHNALQEMRKAKNPRKAILLISDGGDNHSRFTPTEITQVVKESDVQIYVIGVFEPVFHSRLTKEERSGPELLADLSDQTGGRSYPARTLSDLPGLAARVGIELRNQYVLGYAPKNQNNDGAYRKVRVELVRPAGLPNIKATWRAGYYAPHAEP